MISRMEETRIHLIGVLPPDNVERVLTDIKRMLFRTFSLVSGLALGPILPLGYLLEPPEAPRRGLLPPFPPLQTGGWSVEEDTLLLSVDPPPELADLCAAVGLAPADLRSGGERPTGAHEDPIPIRSGLYIAQLREPSHPERLSADTASRQEGKPIAARDILEYLQAAPRLRWHASELACWALRYRDAGRWWDAIVTEELWTVRLRKQSIGRL